MATLIFNFVGYISTQMDNALIDDRRIHVDFSQSVAKLWSQYKGKGRMGGGNGLCSPLLFLLVVCGVFINVMISVYSDTCSRVQ